MIIVENENGSNLDIKHLVRAHCILGLREHISKTFPINNLPKMENLILINNFRNRY